MRKMGSEAEVRARLEELERVAKTDGWLTVDEITGVIILRERLDELEMLGSGGGEG